MIGALVIVHVGSCDCRLYFINRHFADLTELRDFTRLMKIMVKKLSPNGRGFDDGESP